VRGRRELRADFHLRQRMLLELADARLAVAPGTEEEQVAGGMIAPVSVHLPFHVAVRAFAADVELDPHVGREPRLEPERIVADARRIQLAFHDPPEAAVRPPRFAERDAIELVLVRDGGSDGSRTPQECVQEGRLYGEDRQRDGTAIWGASTDAGGQPSDRRVQDRLYLGGRLLGRGALRAHGSSAGSRRAARSPAARAAGIPQPIRQARLELAGPARG